MWTNLHAVELFRMLHQHSVSEDEEVPRLTGGEGRRGVTHGTRQRWAAEGEMEGSGGEGCMAGYDSVGNRKR